MARKNQLREQRAGTIINVTSKQQESHVVQALKKVVNRLEKKFGRRISLAHENRWLLRDIAHDLRNFFPNVDIHHHFNDTFICPDGGILHIRNNLHENVIYPILISEVKNQGTNDMRIKEGLPRQSRGNAIERLGKNLIGLRTALMREHIFPFVCFGHGCDFEEGSYILDRISTMAMFGKLNKIYLYDEEDGKFNRGSFYFRSNQWSITEMAKIMTEIAERSILYYFSKYGEKNFRERSKTINPK